MKFRLTSFDRLDFDAWFEPPFNWTGVRDAEIMRTWHPIRATPTQILLMHAQGAVAELTRSGDRITAVRLIEGDEAERLVRQHAFMVSDEHRIQARKELRPGRDVDSALNQIFGRGHGNLAEIYRSPTSRLYQLSLGAMLEIAVTADNKVTGHKWHTGGAVLDLRKSLDDNKDWAAPAYSKTPLKARTLGEALLYVATQKGTTLDLQVKNDRRMLLVRARIPEGVRIFSFTIAEPGRAERWDMGSGTSPLLDPADLVSFAERVERELPADRSRVTTPERRQARADEIHMAATALRQALRFIPAGADLPPLGIYHTRAGEFLRMKHPERFQRARLEAEIARLEALAASWQS